ncbi:maltose permease [Penaeus vannamei]|uniref:maltose permease n=1 Tax=Penaeus vannamei TaxID=6689 RepID=UPI00387F54AB
MNIDKKMLPMKLHYIAAFAGMGPLIPFLPVIARQKGMSDEAVGMIWTALPFLSLLAKTSAGAMADYLRAHRAIFLSAVVVMGGALTGIYWCPDVGKDSTADFAPEGLSVSNSSRVEGGLAEGGEKSLVGRYEFWLLSILLLLQFCGYMVVLDMEETVCFQMLGDKAHKYGLQRLWGTVSYGVTAVIGGALVDWYSQGYDQKDYLPVHVMVVVALVLDVVVVTRLKFTVPDKKISSTDVHAVFKQPSVLLILMTTVVLGTCGGMVSAFYLLLVEDTAALWSPSFAYLKLLQGLLLGVQCLASEVPCLFLAGKIIKKLGYAASFSLALLGFCLRLCLYSCVSNPWWFLPIELLHGVSFALALASVTCFANSVTPAGAEATMQAVFGSAFHCASGLGGLVGSWLFHVTNGWWRAFFAMGSAVGVYAVLFTIIHVVLTRVGCGKPAVQKEKGGDGSETPTGCCEC